MLLDGAGIPGAESLCSHGVAWYTHRLGGSVLSQLSRDDDHDLAAILASAIDEIAAAHRDTCDIEHVNSPQATVAIVRVHQGHLDYLVLADCFVILEMVGGLTQVITDEREVDNSRICSAPLDGVPVGTPEYDRIWRSCAEAMRARRNQPGGYWIAKDDPQAAHEAVTGTWPVSGLNSVALLSNGASRIVDAYGLTDWPGLLELLDADGPDEVIRRVRQAEARRSDGAEAVLPDDATVAYCTDLSGRALR